MSNSPSPDSRSSASSEGFLGANASNAYLIYMLYLATLLTGVTVLIGVVMAVLNRRAAAGWLKSHYTYQIRTFWIGLLYLGLCVPVAILVPGGFVSFTVVVGWFAFRVLKGMGAISEKKPVDNPGSWLI